MGNRINVWKLIFHLWMPVLIISGSPYPAHPAQAAAKCPPRSTAVEDVSSGKVNCEARDTLETQSFGSGGGDSGAPGFPKEAGKPNVPVTPDAPDRVISGSVVECGLSRWGCEQACQKTYLSAATASAFDAPQRAKVALGACLRICAEEFSCPVRDPKTP